jgi:hypothetical protein
MASGTMISDATVDRFYYIFDSRQQRTLVLDRATGEEVAWTSVPRVQLIEYVAEQRSPQELRRFARWCARQTDVVATSKHSATGALWVAAQGEPTVWSEARSDAGEAVVRAAALGLSQGDPSAARLLVVHACTHPDPARAAIDAAHMSERWAEFNADADPEHDVRRMRQRHVDWLLDALWEGDGDGPGAND